ncbi:MAG TPA: DUF2293 domain-containing protein [Prolixibacteraceae bacterium]|nr:DUF2293 domain-containing protein [Prolixibacteraceae bacterium]
MQIIENDKRIVNPGKNGNLIGEKGEILVPPASWIFLPAGDAGITRKVTAKGVFWRVEVKMGRRTISQGIWAPATTVEQAHDEVNAVRLTDEYKKKRVSEINRRDKKQELYDAEFCKVVEDYLGFDTMYNPMEKILARAITIHAIPIGSGTVARTKMISIEERAAHAVIAWMRHETTAYDNVKIARIKGERRAVRRGFAQESVVLLANYRLGRGISDNCPLQKAIRKIQTDDE